MDFDVVIVMVTLFIGLPWIILHYITRWKTAATITTDDEALLEELYSLAKRLDERMDTVERLVTDAGRRALRVPGALDAGSLREYVLQQPAVAPGSGTVSDPRPSQAGRKGNEHSMKRQR